MDMDIATLRHVLLYCTVLNYGCLLFWVALTLVGHGWMPRFYGKLFHLSAENFGAINFAGILLYKLGIILFNLVPLIAICLAS